MTAGSRERMSAAKPPSQATPQTGMERRRSPRVLVDLEVDYGNEDNFLFAYITDISTTGIFVRTNAPEAPGTRLNVRFTPHAGEDIRDAEPLELEGEVIWVNPYRPGHKNSIYPGMGVRFVDLQDGQRRKLTDFVTTFAYLDPTRCV